MRRHSEMTPPTAPMKRWGHWRGGVRQGQANTPRASDGLNAAILRPPHGVLNLLYHVFECDAGESLGDRRLGNRRSHRHGDTAQVVDMREERSTGLMHGYKAGHGVSGRREHAV